MGCIVVIMIKHPSIQKEPMTIGKVAKAAGVGVETIRFYERKGLIEDPPRQKSGYRQYPPETVARVLFIRRASQLGFTLNEAKELLDLKASPDFECAEVRKQAEAKMEEIQRKIDSLEKMNRALKELTEICRSENTSAECPILHAIEE